MQVTLTEHDRGLVHLYNSLRGQLIAVDELVSQHFNIELSFFLGARSPLLHTTLSFLQGLECLLALS